MIGDMGGFGMGIFGWIFTILFLGLIILGFFALVKWLITTKSDRQSKMTPLEILQERYARGDIDQEEYEKKKSVLKG